MIRITMRSWWECWAVQVWLYHDGAVFSRCRPWYSIKPSGYAKKRVLGPVTTTAKREG